VFDSALAIASEVVATVDSKEDKGSKEEEREVETVRGNQGAAEHRYTESFMAEGDVYEFPKLKSASLSFLDSRNLDAGDGILTLTITVTSHIMKTHVRIRITRGTAILLPQTPFQTLS
jgi:hypothetical protein